MKRKHKFIFLILTIIGSCMSANAQQAISESDNGYFSKKYANSSLFNRFPPVWSFSAYEGIPINGNEAQNYGPYVPKVYNYKALAFFCKLEVKMEKNAKLPIKVRLGDVDYVDWLEGKRDRY